MKKMTLPTQDGESLTARVGEPVRIVLSSTPGTGAMWYPSSIPPHAEIATMDSIPTGTGVGGSVQQVFLFTADAPGTYTLSFQLKRAWEPVVRSERHFIIRVDLAVT
jgi:predicted secreted protein